MSFDVLGDLNWLAVIVAAEEIEGGPGAAVYAVPLVGAWQ